MLFFVLQTPPELAQFARGPTYTSVSRSIACRARPCFVLFWFAVRNTVLTSTDSTIVRGVLRCAVLKEYVERRCRS